MVNEIMYAVLGSAVTLLACSGHIKAKIEKAKNDTNAILNNKDYAYKKMEQNFKNERIEKNQLTVDYQQLKKEFQQLAEEHAARKEANSKLAAGNNSIAKDYHALKDKYEDLLTEHKELQEKYKPLAALNPFERQAVGAVTNQSILDEWMNGEIKEGN